jgi:hypothetical protein
MSSGIVSGLGRELPTSPTGVPITGVIQTDAAINPGARSRARRTGCLMPAAPRPARRCQPPLEPFPSWPPQTYCRQLGRPAAQQPRRAGRHQHRHPLGQRQQQRRRVRDPNRHRQGPGGAGAGPRAGAPKGLAERRAGPTLEPVQLRARPQPGPLPAPNPAAPAPSHPLSPSDPPVRPRGAALPGRRARARHARAAHGSGGRRRPGRRARRPRRGGGPQAQQQVRRLGARGAGGGRCSILTPGSGVGLCTPCRRAAQAPTRGCSAGAPPPNPAQTPPPPLPLPPETPRELFGTRLGDVVVGLNGRPVKSEKDLFAALDTCRWGRGAARGPLRRRVCGGPREPPRAVGGRRPQSAGFPHSSCISFASLR